MSQPQRVLQARGCAAGQFEGEMVVEEAISSSGLSSGLGRMMKPTRSPGETVFENDEV